MAKLPLAASPSLMVMVVLCVLTCSPCAHCIVVTPQHSDLQRFSTVIFTFSLFAHFTELAGWLAGYGAGALDGAQRQPAIVRNEYCTT